MVVDGQGNGTGHVQSNTPTNSNNTVAVAPGKCSFTVQNVRLHWVFVHFGINRRSNAGLFHVLNDFEEEWKGGNDRVGYYQWAHFPLFFQVA